MMKFLKMKLAELWKIGVVLSNSALLLKRKWILTTLRIVVPIIAIFYAVSSPGSYFINIKTNNTILSRIEEEFMLNARRLPNFNFLYTPSNDYTNKIMELIALTIPQRRLKNITAVKDEETITEIASRYTQLTTSSLVGIIFEDNLATSGDSIKYKIRIADNTDFHTEDVYPLSLDEVRTIFTNEYYSSKFLAVQLALDRAIIKYYNDSVTFDKITISLMPDPSDSSMVDPMQYLNKVQQLATIYILINMIPNFSILRDVIYEKSSGVKELLKMMGLPSLFSRFGWLLDALIINWISSIVIALLLTTNILQSSITPILFHYSKTIVVIVILILHNSATVYRNFLITACVDEPIVGMVVSLVLTLISVFVGYTSIPASGYTTSYWITFVTIALADGVLIRSFKIIAFLEIDNEGATWSTITTNVPGYGSLLQMMINLIILSFCNWLLAWYIEEIRPGPYGRPKSFIFPLKNLSSQPAEVDDSNYIAMESKILKEKVPANIDVGIKIVRLKKKYTKLEALKGITLDIHKGEITVLLGRNGAGKSTLINVLTGMLPATSGNVFSNGINILDNVEKFRESLGVCPQHNLLYHDLYVKEHLVYFGKLKGLSHSKAIVEAKKLIDTLKFESQKNSSVSELSGGQQRKLSVAIALVGNPEVVILDEPTSGIDIETRRLVWDLLLKLRGTRTVLLSTHSMEEADVLGDRVAIIDHGNLICYGTSIFLKKSFDVGYQLKIKKCDSCDTKNLVKNIQSFEKRAIVKMESEEYININLPLDTTKNFPRLFQFLESGKETLGIDSISLSSRSLEEVFFKAGKMTENGDRSNDVDSISSAIDEKYDDELFKAKETQKRYFWKQLSSSIVTHLKFIMRLFGVYLIFCMLPIIFSACAVYFTNVYFKSSSTSESPAVSLTLSTQPYTQVITMSNSNNSLWSSYNDVAARMGASIRHASDSVSDEISKLGSKDVTKFRRRLFASAEFNETDINLFYNGFPYHSLPMSLNLISNSILNEAVEGNKAIITTVNHPLLTRKLEICPEVKPFILQVVVTIWSLFEEIPLMTFLAIFIIRPSIERVSGYRHLLYMSNLGRRTYWVANFIVDYVLSAIVSVFVVVFIYYFDYLTVFTHYDDLVALVSLLACVNLAFILYAYVFSLPFRNTHFAQGSLLAVTLAIGVSGIIRLFGQNVPNVFQQLDDSLSAPPFKSGFLIFAYILFPPLTLHSGLSQWVVTTWKNNRCVYCTSEKSQTNCISSVATGPMGHFTWDSNGILQHLLFFAISSLTCIAILMLAELGVFRRIGLLMRNIIHGKAKATLGGLNDDVEKEREKVVQILEGKYDGGEQMLVVDNLVKEYTGLLSRHKAVNGISFTVAGGKCFGLLGVNGAGKSTTFKLLSSELLANDGDSMVKNVKLSQDRINYLKKIGYCPQNDALLNQLTVWEVLKHFCTVRGVDEDVNAVTEKWIHYLGLKEYKNAKCGALSGGNKRKVNTGMAAIGNPLIIFLDEPGTGVDPISRIKLYRLVECIKNSGRSIVFTSHSMQECERVCDRLTIMIDGRMRCIGDVQYLKERFAQGFSLEIKLRTPVDADNLSSLKQDVLQSFNYNINLRDENRGLLDYHILDTKLQYSWLFTTVEGLKNKYDIIDDYVISDTSLEQVFLAIAKEKRN